MGAPAENNGWTLLRHALFGEPYDALEAEVSRLKAADPDGYVQHPKAKLFARITEIIFDEIPRDPADPKYRLGNTLGPANKHWFRAKFLGRFRLFFRFDSREKIIIYCWVNDETTLRKAGSKLDPYEIFKAMLIAGDPPETWAELKNRVKTAGSET